MKRFFLLSLAALALSACDMYQKVELPTPETSLDIQRARSGAGEKDVWVLGYVVGCATSTSKAVFEPPFPKNTNLVLGPSADTADRDLCLAVELPSGAVRSALNLVDNPEMLGRAVYVKGDLVGSYYGIPGLKAVTEYYDPRQ